MRAALWLASIWVAFFVGAWMDGIYAENDKWTTLAVYEGYIAQRDALIRTLIVQVDSANAVARRSIAGMKRSNAIAERAITSMRFDMQYNQVIPGLVLWPDSARDSTWGAETIPCPDGIPGCLVHHWKPARVPPYSAVGTRTVPRVSTLRVR